MSPWTRPRRATHHALLLAFALALPWLAGCQPGANTDNGAAGPAARPAERPVDAVYFLRDRLLARDGAGFARVALPPELHAQVEAGWRDGRSRWPLEELPLESDIPRMLAALQEPDAARNLTASFRGQFDGADRDLDQAVRTVVVFGRGYIHEDPDYGDDERDHVDQALVALGDWALAAPLTDTRRAQHLFGALTAAAAHTGIDGRSATAAFQQLGMDQSLTRLSRFFATLLTQLRLQYGLDFDTSLRSAKVSLLQQTGDSAQLRLQYVLAGRDIDALVPVVRIDGHWYLADYVARARRSLGGHGAANTTAAAAGKS